MTVVTKTDGPVLVVTIDRPDVRNAVDRSTADRLTEAFASFDADDGLSVAVLTGAGGNFSAGADLKAIGDGRGNRVDIEMDRPGPLGPTRMVLSKPTIAAVEGYAVAGGLELAVWCDLRVVAADAVFGVFCRRWGVPLVDGGTIRLPRLIGQSRALDMILTGRPVTGEEAVRMGLANRVVEPGEALETAIELAHALADTPQTCLRNDRRSVLEQWDSPFDQALARETELGLDSVASPEMRAAVGRFVEGAGRGGAST